MEKCNVFSLEIFPYSHEIKYLLPTFRLAVKNENNLSIAVCVYMWAEDILARQSARLEIPPKVMLEYFRIIWILMC